MKNKSDSIKELAAALVAAQSEFPVLERDKEAHHGKYSDFEQVTSKTKPILQKHGLAITQLPGSMPGGDSTLETVIIHTSGEYISSTLRLYVSKQDSQGYGAALTYAKRQAWKAVLGVAESDDPTDDDGDNSMVMSTEHKRILFALARKYHQITEMHEFEAMIFELTGNHVDRMLDSSFKDLAESIKTGELIRTEE